MFIKRLAQQAMALICAIQTAMELVETIRNTQNNVSKKTRRHRKRRNNQLRPLATIPLRKG